MHTYLEKKIKTYIRHYFPFLPFLIIVKLFFKLQSIDHDNYSQENNSKQ